jgi:hypothetical protein
MAVRHIIRSQPQSMLVQPISKIMPFILTLESQFDRLSRMTSLLEISSAGVCRPVANPDVRASAGGSRSELGEPPLFPLEVKMLWIGP